MRAALFALASAGERARPDANALTQALALWRNVQSVVKLIVEEPFDEEQWSPAMKALLAESAGAVDFAVLKSDMDAAATSALAIYDRIVEVPAAAARARLAAAASPNPSEEERTS
jgi:hypothetical protein